MEKKVKSPLIKGYTRMEAKRALWGYIFISLWLIGAIMFFVVPLVRSFLYSINEIHLDAGGMRLEFVGWANFEHLFLRDHNFLQNLWASVRDMVLNVPVIVAFSLFTAVILKEKFRGRTVARAMFFFPVIIASGVVMAVMHHEILQGAGGDLGQAGESQQGYLFQAPDIVSIFANMGIPEQLLEFVTNVLNRLFDLTWKSGVQILLLLAAVNAIPKSSYEAADIEGATGWEKFWKITLPLVSPTLVVTIIYSIIDSFTDFDNPIIQQSRDFMGRGMLSLSTTVGFVYFIAVLLVIGLVYFVINKFAFYETGK